MSEVLLYGMVSWIKQEKGSEFSVETWKRDARDTFHFQILTKLQVTPDEHGRLAAAAFV